MREKYDIYGFNKCKKPNKKPIVSLYIDTINYCKIVPEKKIIFWKFFQFLPTDDFYET